MIMNNEIKINKANKSITFINNGIAFSQFGIADEILDLITNLQQEKEDYKSRCEKASEYIKEAIENGDYFEDDIATDISEPSYDKYVNSDSLLNILQNGSDEK